MPTAIERLAGVRAKIERAKHHVNDLAARIQAFRTGDPYLLLCEQDPNTRDIVARVQIRAQPPVDFSTIAGDAAHNLRSGLDHLAWQLVEAGGGTPDRNTAFPIYEARPENERSFARKVKGMRPDAIHVVQAVQPYESGSPALSLLNDLDNLDKHRLLYVIAYGFVGASFHYENPTLIDQIPGLREFMADYLQDQREPEPLSTVGGFPILHDGAEVFRLAWNDGPRINMDHDIDFTYSLAFAKPEFAEGRTVVPLLTQLSQFVSDVVDEFIPFLE